MLGLVMNTFAAGEAYDVRLVFDLDVGSPADEGHVGYGWSRGERNPERSFRWIRALEADATLMVNNVAEDDTDGVFHLAVLAAPYYVEGKRQNVGVFVNNTYVDEWVCDDGPDYHTYGVDIPKDMLKPGPNRLTLRMGYRQKPHRGDTRRLALAVDRIVVEYRTLAAAPVTELEP